MLRSIYGGAGVDIPVPIFREVKPPVLASWKGLGGRGYVLFDRADVELVEDMLEYDADWKDDVFARQVNVDIALVEASMDSLEKAQQRVEGRQLMTYAAARTVLQHVLGKTTEANRKDLFAHWHKRRSQRGSSFIRLFQPPPNPKDQDPSVAFRPRERDPLSGVARRMNTYENYKKALVLRSELLQLKQLLHMVVQREQTKRELLSLKLLSQRLRTTSGGQRIDTAIKAVFQSESEPVLPLASTLVPCRGLNLPPLPIVHRKMIDKPKKLRRKSRPVEKPKKQLVIDRMPPGVDAFGYDEIGNKFLKHMRYFAGGFMNYGVSPYDHRVFAAASERNTVRCLPTQPDPVEFPGIGFGEPRGGGGGKAKRLVSCEEIAEDILNSFAKFSGEEPPPPPKKCRRTIRVRTRVGRGGRIMLDRVSYERERGVRAASYPASVEVGGVYTGGIPLDCAEKNDERGYMGYVKLLASGESEHLSDSAKRLIPQIDSLYSEEAWPSRGGKKRPRRIEPPDDIRRLPAYAPRNEPLVAEI